MEKFSEYQKISIHPLLQWKSGLVDESKIYFAMNPNPIHCAYLLFIMYNVAFIMQLITVPYFIKSMGISDIENGYVQTTFGAFRMLGAPLFGRIVQQFGIRFGLHLCYAATLISGVLLYLSYDITSLLFSRIPCMCMHGQQAHQVLISQLTNPGQERTNAFCRMGLAFGLAFVLVPAISMIFVSVTFVSGPILLSSAIAAVPLLICDFCIDPSAYENSNSSMSAEVVRPSTVSTITCVLSRPGVLNVIFKKITPFVPMILISSVLETVAFVLFFLFCRLWMIVIIMPFIAIGLSLVDAAADSLLTTLVSEDEQCLILGVVTSFNSLVRTVAPTVSSYILNKHGFSTLGLIGVLSTACGQAAVFLLPLDEKLLIGKHKSS
ncbi:unnamed protein product [Nippostrongylus brasiliensis]|uniref:MFS domain-containing protein n=1 Tax=Nippostrongylus brasiliensis TaxID=27835 RepID=A0A0N4XEQ7_NIPBR|nr:unnamed protein product [Nippostrongylus brasiliensis]